MDNAVSRVAFATEKSDWIFCSEAKYTEPNNDIGNLSDIGDLDLGDTLPSITSESSGVVSGLTSSVHSCANSAGTVPSPREPAMEIQENPPTNHRLKSAMVRNLFYTIISIKALTKTEEMFDL